MNPYLELVNDLYSASTPATRCPHLAKDEKGCWCRSPGCREEERRLVVDYASLQLWCLDGERFRKCHFFQDRPENASA